MKAGITQPDNIKKALPTMNMTYKWNGMALNRKQIFIKNWVKVKGETEVSNKISDITGGLMNYLDDSVIIYERIRKTDKADEIDFHGNITEIHNRLAKIDKSIIKPNRPIPSTPTERKREFETSRYQILLAEDTDRLTHIGEIMHICVGSYDQRVLNKACTIYYMFDKVTQKYAACIEVHKKVLCQAKGYCNSRVEGDVFAALDEWVNTFHIATENCWDYEGALKQYKSALDQPADMAV